MLVAGAAIGLAGSMPAGAHQATPAAKPAPVKIDPKDYPKLEKKDQLIFRTGNKVEGVILDETETTIRFLVIYSGSMRSEASYAKADVLEIKRDAFKPEAAKDGDKKEAGKAEDDKSHQDKVTEPAKGDGKDDAVVDVSGKPIPAGNLTVYVINMAGPFPKGCSNTPMEKVVADIKRLQPDILVARFDHQFTNRGRQTVDFDSDEGAFDVLEKARELDTILNDQILNDSSIKQPRRVAWIKKALGAACFLPFTFPEIYFTSDGLMGGVGGIEHLFDGVGDERAREKQRSLRMGRAKGLAVKGGHPEEIMMAMADGRFALSYKIVGGDVKFLPRMPEGPDEILLKDDGAVNPEHSDSMEDMVRMKGNDYLTLDAVTAQRIGFSKGTADTLDDLMFKMGITRNYSQLKNKSRDILAEWAQDVAKAERDLQKIFRDYQGVQVKPPGGYKERTAARTIRKGYLRQAMSIAEKYGEAINPRLIQGSADTLLGRLRVIIDQIEQEQRLDRPEP